MGIDSNRAIYVSPSRPFPDQTNGLLILPGTQDPRTKENTKDLHSPSLVLYKVTKIKVTKMLHFPYQKG